MIPPIEEVYFNWLYTKALGSIGNTPSTSYQSLLYALHTKEFPWLVTGDDNRVEEGKSLRKSFLSSISFDDEDQEVIFWYGLNCSVLEMLIAFSERASFNSSINQKDWFLIFLNNLGLGEYSDASYNAIITNDIIDRFIWRNYDEYGHGGLFPLTYSKHNQKDLEIWYQFCEYLVDQNIP